MRSSVLVKGLLAIVHIMGPALKCTAGILWGMHKYYAHKFWMHLTRSDASVIETIRQRESTIPQNDKADSAPISKKVIHLKRKK